MRQLLRKATSLSLAMLLTIFSVAIHVTAFLPYPVHAGNGTGHATNTSNCGSICALATSYKDELVAVDDDDEPQTPFYLQLRSSALVGLEKEHDLETKTAIKREPPPDGLPAYIALTVFRV